MSLFNRIMGLLRPPAPAPVPRFDPMPLPKPHWALAVKGCTRTYEDVTIHFANSAAADQFYKQFEEQFK